MKPGTENRVKVIQSMSATDFRRVMGLGDDAAFAAFEAEWDAYETRLVQTRTSLDWETEARRILKALGK